MKLTRNDVRRMFTKIYELGYCEYQNELNKFKKIGYNSGLYGWNYDVYMIDYDTCIVTGYRPFGEKITSEVINKITQ